MSSAPSPCEIPVDLGFFLLAFEDHDLTHEWYLDLQSGDVFVVADDVEEDVLPVPRDELEDSPRFLPIAREDSHEAYGDMVEFAETVPPPLRQRLEQALHGKGAFRRFKDVLLSAMHERERWFRFREGRLDARGREWLRANGIVVTPRGGHDPAGLRER